MPAPASVDTDRPTVPVPPSIFFDYDLLLVPTLQEVGIPDELAGLGRYHPEVKLGQWVTRGEPLVAAHISFYQREQKPWWSWLTDDPVWSIDPTLMSPVSGLVVDFRRQRTRIHAPWGVVYVGEENVLPVLLIPRDEPPQDYWRLAFYGEIGTALRDHWKLLPYYSGHADLRARLGQVGDDLQGSWRDALRCIAEFREPCREEFEVRPMSHQDKAIVSNVQSMRAYDLILRDKLLHLTNNSDGRA